MGMKKAVTPAAGLLFNVNLKTGLTAEQKELAAKEMFGSGYKAKESK